MPNNKTKQKRKNVRAKGGVVSASMPKPLLPNTTRARLHYTRFGNYTEAAAGGSYTYSYRLTDLYDPDYTGTGNQPVGFDQFTAIYSRFRVLSVSVKLQFQSMTPGGVVGAYPSVEPTLSAAQLSWPSQPLAESGLVSTNTPGQSFTWRIKPWDVYRISKSQYMMEADFAGTSAASPLRNVYLHTWIRGLGGSVSTAAVMVRIAFEVEFYGPVPLSIS